MTDSRSLVAGQSARSRSAIRNLNRICETVLNNRCDVQIVDVLEQPQIAESDGILATPTLIKEPFSPETLSGKLRDLLD